MICTRAVFSLRVSTRLILIGEGERCFFLIIADIPRGADFIRDDVGFQLLFRDHRGYSGVALGTLEVRVWGSGQMSIQRFRQVVSKARLVTADAEWFPRWLVQYARGGPACFKLGAKHKKPPAERRFIRRLAFIGPFNRISWTCGPRLEASRATQRR